MCETACAREIERHVLIVVERDINHFVCLSPSPFIERVEIGRFERQRVEKESRKNES